jgi:hypothetical protein
MTTPTTTLTTWAVVPNNSSALLFSEDIGLEEQETRGC